jgi:molybdate transport system substrate-binding protein
MALGPRTLISLSRSLSLSLSLALALGCHQPEPEVTIAAATSLREVMPALIASYEAARPGRHVTATYAASGDLKQQVEVGAPIDAVFFAGGRPADELVSEGKAEAASRVVVASNQLVLVGRPGARLLSFESLSALPKDEKLAVGDPRTVPAGEYAKSYLTALGEWETLQDRIITGSNVAAVMVYARRGEAAAAIVYRTEVRGTADLVVLDAAHGKDAPRPIVVAALVKGGRPVAADFITFASKAEETWRAFGFGPP